MADVFARYGPLHPHQMLAVDKDGVRVASVPLSLHGMRLMKFTDLAGTTAASCYFSEAMLTLLVGVGFVHGVCKEYLPAELIFQDGLVWESPFRCT